eukprot:56561-Eustigmatos_ZCMA.PRE.1
MGANAQHPAAMANLGYLLCRQAMGVAAQLTKGGKATSHTLRGGEGQLRDAKVGVVSTYDR